MQKYNSYRTNQLVQFDVSGGHRHSVRANVLQIKHTSDGVFGIVRSLDWKLRSADLERPMRVRYAKCSEWYPVDAKGQRIPYSHPFAETQYQHWLELARKRVARRKALMLERIGRKNQLEGK